MGLYQQLLDAIATHRVADRPDRFEPRLENADPNTTASCGNQERETKRDMANGVSVKLRAIRRCDEWHVNLQQVHSSD